MDQSTLEIGKELCHELSNRKNKGTETHTHNNVFVNVVQHGILSACLHTFCIVRLIRRLQNGSKIVAVNERDTLYLISIQPSDLPNPSSAPRLSRFVPFPVKYQNILMNVIQNRGSETVLNYVNTKVCLNKEGTMGKGVDFTGARISGF